MYLISSTCIIMELKLMKLLSGRLMTWAYSSQFWREQCMIEGAPAGYVETINQAVDTTRVLAERYNKRG